MGSQIATAFVRIKPNMTGFKAETESGVKGAFSKVAKIIGAALGARAAYEITKSSVEAAALLQKQLETVRAEFGKAGQSLIDFANNAGTSLGAVNTDTLAASTRFGILFKNLGIGPQLAAQMTKGFEKLAIATNAIRGGSTSDAAQLLQILAKGAATGRGLNQLGVAVNSTQIQIAAFKLGLTKTITEALTPGEKAIAIYALATRNLGGVMAQAKKHGHDFSDVQSTLTAEWAKAKEALGKALLPEITKLVSKFTNWLGKLEKSGKLQKDFNAFGRVAAKVVQAVADAVQTGVGIWHKFTGAVGGTKNAVKILLAVMAVSKFVAIGGEVKKLAGLFSGVLTKAFNIAKLGYAILTGTMTAETEATALAIKASLISTGIGALVVAIGIAAAFIITHWDLVKRWTVALGHVMAQVWRGVMHIFVGGAEFIGASIVKFLIFPMKEFIDIAASAVGWIPYVGDGVNAVKDKVDGLYNSMSKFATSGKNRLLQGAHEFGTLGQTWTDSMAKSASDPSQKKKLKDAGKKAADSFNTGLTGGITTGANSAVKKLTEALHQTIADANQKIRESISAAKDNLVRIGDDLARTIDKIQSKLGGADGAIAGSPQGQAFAKLKKLIESGAPSFQIQRAARSLSTQLEGVGKQHADTIKRQLDNLTGAFNKGKIGYKEFESRLHEILRKNGITMKEALKVGGTAFADTFKAQVAALGQQAKAIADLPAKYRHVGGAGGSADIKIIRPLETIRTQDLRIATAAAKQRDAQLKATEKTNAELKQLKQKIITRLPGHGKHPHGKGSKDARTGAAVGSRG